MAYVGSIINQTTLTTTSFGLEKLARKNKTDEKRNNDGKKQNIGTKHTTMFCFFYNNNKSYITIYLNIQRPVKRHMLACLISKTMLRTHSKYSV